MSLLQIQVHILLAWCLHLDTFKCILFSTVKSHFLSSLSLQSVAYPGILFGRGSTNSVEDRGQGEWGSGGGSPLIRGSAQFAIRFDFVKLSGCRVFLRIYFSLNWEFGSALSKFRGEGVLNPPLGTPQPTVNSFFMINSSTVTQHC
jgi:hypothetical protein